MDVAPSAEYDIEFYTLPRTTNKFNRLATTPSFWYTLEGLATREEDVIVYGT